MAPPKKPKPRKSKPLPSLIAPKITWQIKASKTPSTNLTTGVVAVPLGVGEVDRALRNREMLKVKWSPKKLAAGPDIDPHIMEVCEEVRVKWRGHQIGVDTGEQVNFLSDAEIDELVNHGSDKDIVTTIVGSTFSGDASRVCTCLHGSRPYREVHSLYTRANQAVRLATRNFGKSPGPVNAAIAARWLTELYAEPPDDPDEANNNTSNNAELSNSPSEVRESLREVGQYADFDALDREDKMLAEEHEEQQVGGAPPTVLTNQTDNWCKMTITEPKRTVRFPSKMRGRAWKATDQGHVLRYPHRWCADKTMFAARAQKPGGCTVLIDASGSMHFTGEQIFQVMKLMPAATIAAYNGNDRVGELRILAKKGRRVDELLLKPRYGGNGVDGPALDWLSKQPGPRYWVSDGQVFGLDGAQSPAMLAAVYKCCRDHHILRIDSLAEVIERFG